MSRPERERERTRVFGYVCKTLVYAREFLCVCVCVCVCVFVCIRKRVMNIKDKVCWLFLSWLYKCSPFIIVYPLEGRLGRVREGSA